MVHIGIIPDGNRRWCKKNNIDYNLENLQDIWFRLLLEHVRQISINENKYNNLFKITDITFYVCSIENIKRNDNTSQFIYKFLEKIFHLYDNREKVVDEIYKDEDNDKKDFINHYLSFIINELNIIPIGELHLLPDYIQLKLKELKYKNDKSKKYNLYLGIAYDFNKDLINYGSNNNVNYNRTHKNIDIVLRTGGELRISGFFPCDINYAEFYYYKKLWPEITIQDFDNIVYDFFNVRQRRFGK